MRDIIVCVVRVVQFYAEHWEWTHLCACSCVCIYICVRMCLCVCVCLCVCGGSFFVSLPVSPRLSYAYVNEYSCQRSATHPVIVCVCVHVFLMLPAV